MSYEFKKLTKAQQHTLSLIAIDENRGFFNDRVIEKLLGLGLIEKAPDLVLPGRFVVHVKRYVMPLPVHIAWCEYCSETCGEE